MTASVIRSQSYRFLGYGYIYRIKDVDADECYHYADLCQPREIQEP